MVYQFNSYGEKDTGRLAEALAARFQAGTVIALDGDLGAGKTTFSQAVGAAMGVQETVNSPTFTLIKEYEGAELPLYHMDVYRISLEEAEEMGLDEYFFGRGVTLLEWASIVEDLLPEERLSIYIETSGWTDRVFRLQPLGEPYVSWCERMKEEGLLLQAEDE